MWKVNGRMRIPEGDDYREHIDMPEECECGSEEQVIAPPGLKPWEGGDEGTCPDCGGWRKIK